MRTITLLAVVSLFFLASCKKNCSRAETMSGNWEWVKSSAMLVQTPQNTGKDWALSFSTNLSVSQSGTLYPPATGTYRLQNGSLQVDFPSINSSSIYQVSYRTADTLLLDAGSSFDNPIHFFVRK